MKREREREGGREGERGGERTEELRGEKVKGRGRESSKRKCYAIVIY